MATSYFRRSLARSFEYDVGKTASRQYDNAREASVASYMARSSLAERPTTSSAIGVAKQHVWPNTISERIQALVFSS